MLNADWSNLWQPPEAPKMSPLYQQPPPELFVGAMHDFSSAHNTHHLITRLNIDFVR